MSVPCENHLQAPHKNGIPSRLYAVLDAVGKAGIVWKQGGATNVLRMSTRKKSSPHTQSLS